MFTSFGSVAGSVVDPAGMPVGDAQVQLTDGLRSRTTGTSTGSNGTFAFDDVLPGAYTLAVRSTGTETVERMFVVQIDIAPGETVRRDGLRLPLEDLGQISGVVTGADDQRLGLATVTLVGGGQTLSFVTTSTGAGAGAFTFAGLYVPGTYQLSVTAANYAPQSVPVELSFAGGAFIVTQDVELAPNPGPVTGVVNATDGTPVVDAVVTITDAAGTVQTSTTDQSGIFSFADVAAGASVIDIELNTPAGTGSLTDAPFTVPAGGGDPESAFVMTVTPPPAPRPGAPADGATP